MKDKWYYPVGLTIVVLITTLFIRIPIPSKGYFNFGDVAVVFAGLLLGRKVGFIAGGIGSALADIISGYVIFAPLTFFAKGIEGYLCGFAKEKHGLLFHLMPLLGTIAMVGVYFAGESFMPQVGFAGALAELVPNLIQAVGAFVGGKALYMMFSKSQAVEA